jgi:predicted ATP-grasp superfamily ATP-dependent carboligase
LVDPGWSPTERTAEPVNVLVTDGVMKKSLAVVRSIAPLTARTGVTSPYPVSMAGVSAATDDQHVVDRESANAFVADLNATIDGHSYDYVLPVGGWTTKVLSERRDDVRTPVEDVLPDREAMAVAQDKWETYRLAKRLDVPVPETVRATDEDDGVKAAQDLGFPLVVKAPNESLPRFVERVNSPAVLRGAVRDYRRRYDAAPLVQEAVPGEGCGFFGLYLDGECTGQYTHRRVREYPPAGGASACAESVRDDRLAELGRRVLRDLSWTGPAMVEFKRDADGEPALIEINPKFWGSLDLGIASGLGFPHALLDHAANGRRPDFSFTPRRYHWPLSGDLQHALRRPASAPDVVADLLSRDTRSNISFGDPLPHLFECAKAVLSPVVN